MGRMQFSLTGLLVAVLVLAVACAALMSHSEIVASAAVTLQIGLLAFGIVGIVCRREAKRAFWVGFTVFGLVYASASNQIMLQAWGFGGGWQTGGTELLTEKFLQFIFSQKKFHPHVGMLVEAKWPNAGGSYYPAKIIEIADDGQIHVEWVGSPGDQWTAPKDVRADWRVHIVTGHSVFCLLIAILGGFIARIFGAANRDNLSHEMNPADTQAK